MINSSFRNIAYNKSFNAGYFLFNPAFYLTNDIMRVFVVPLKPKQYGQYPKVIEIIYRVLVVFRILLVLPFAITFGIPGAFLLFIGQKGRNKFALHGPKEALKLQDQLPKTLKIATFNAALMPEFIATRNKLPPTKVRVERVTKAILQRDDDIVCLQECFDHKSTPKLAKSLLSKYPYIITDVGHFGFGLSSGLMVASKYPLHDIQFNAYTERGGVDKGAQKGVLSFRAQLSNQHEAIFFNTHLNGGAEATLPSGKIVSGDYFRRKQMQQLKNEIDAYKLGKSSRQIAAVWVCGDFNIGPREIPTAINPEWTNNLDFFRTRFTEFYDGEGPKDSLPNTGTAINEEAIWLEDTNKVVLGSECLDHLLTETNSMAIPQDPKLSRDLMEVSSDHAAIRGTFNFYS